MAIPASGQFFYEAIVNSVFGGGWRGLASPQTDGSRHPGLVGDRPQLELGSGVLTLRRTEPKGPPLDRHYETCGPSASQVSFRVGAALEAVIQDGDRVSVLRGGTADLGVEVFRGEDALMGLGVVRDRFGSLIIEEDPRAHYVRDLPRTRPDDLFIR